MIDGLIGLLDIAYENAYRKTNTVKKYRTKPCEIEAIQWTGNNEEEILSFVKNKHYISFDGDLYLITLEGEMKANVGDYIIKGLRGDFYPCKPDVFQKKYELIDGKGGVWIIVL